MSLSARPPRPPSACGKVVRAIEERSIEPLWDWNHEMRGVKLAMVTAEV